MNRDPKSQKGPYRDPVPKIGTLLTSVHMYIPCNIARDTRENPPFMYNRGLVCKEEQPGLIPFGHLQCFLTTNRVVRNTLSNSNTNTVDHLREILLEEDW